MNRAVYGGGLISGVRREIGPFRSLAGGFGCLEESQMHPFLMGVHLSANGVQLAVQT